MQATTSVMLEPLTIGTDVFMNAVMEPADKPHAAAVVAKKPSDMGDDQSHNTYHLCH